MGQCITYFPVTGCNFSDRNNININTPVYINTISQFQVLYANIYINISKPCREIDSISNMNMNE